MSTKTQKFSAGSSNFLVNILNFLLSSLALSGVELPADPASISGDIVNALSPTGWIAVVGIIAINVISPIYHAFLKGSFSLKGLLSSSNFWIQFGTLLAAAVALFGLILPAGTTEQVVGAVYAKDWTTLAIILFTNIITPLVRFFKDKVAASAA